MTLVAAFLILIVTAFTSEGSGKAGSKPKPVKEVASTTPHQLPHAVFAKLHIGMSEDSARIVFRQIALRRDTLHVDSLLLMESDSVRILGQPAYIEAQILHHKIRTLVINFHPLSGPSYLGVRDVVDAYMMRLFGRGIEETDETLTHHRWETEEGTMEVSHSDKYERVFIRLGKPRV